MADQTVPGTTIPKDTGTDLPPVNAKGLEKEPIISRTVAGALAGVVVAIAVNAGVPEDTFSDTTMEILTLGIVGAGPTLGAWWARLKAWAPDSVERAIAEAWRAGQAGRNRPSIQ